MTAPLIHRLEPYPHLREALGLEWISEQDRIDPILSPFPLARWLRLDGFEPDLTMLDVVLGRLSTISGIGDRRKRLQADAPALMETLTELYFGAWLLDLGYTFDWPRQGADFTVHLGADQRLRIEATTPRKAAWSGDLFERLHLVALRTGCSMRIEHSLEMLPNPARSSDIVGTIVREVLDAIELSDVLCQRQEPQQTGRDYPEVGIKVAWTSSETPIIRAVTSPGPLSPYSGFGYLINAAKSKTHQLPEGQAGVLLIGTSQLPTLAWESFHDALRNVPPEDMQFPWNQVPGQVKHVILYSMELRKIEPFKATWIVNPASPLPDAPGVMQFLRELFPNSLHRNKTG